MPFTAKPWEDVAQGMPLRRRIAQRIAHCFTDACIAQDCLRSEVIVHAYEEWGVDCLPRLNGMFAFALWDGRQESLFLARDRIGKKPLYYQARDATFLFGSELKALLAHPGVGTCIDLTAVVDYFKYLYVPDPKTIFEGIRKLLPAHYLLARKGNVTIKQYWGVRFDSTTAASESELVDELSDLLEQAVRDRMVTDVPLGAFLSGGIDSSGVVAFMACQSAQPVVACTIGFDDPDHDESRYAAQVAHYLGTSHHEFSIQANFLDAVRRFPAMFDEPFADASALPTYHLCRMARQQVTVALTGDGGDENFGGYDKYVKDAIEQFLGGIVPDPLLGMMNRTCIGRGVLQQRVRTLTAQARRSPAQAFYETNTLIADQELESLLEPEIARRIKGYDPSEYMGQFFNSIDTDDHLTRMLSTPISKPICPAISSSRWTG